MTRPTQLNRGLVGAWCPSLGNTGLRLYDRTVRKNHGTLTNMASTAWVTSGGKGALRFDGVNDWVESNAPAIGSLTQNVTVSLWMTVSATGRTSTLYSVNAATNVNQRCQAIVPWSDNNIYFDFGGSSGVNRLTITGQSWPLNSWNHMVFIAGSIGMQVWRNGLLIGSSATAVTRSVSSNLFYLGGSIADNLGNPNYYHAGLQDDARAYNRNLTAPEIRQLYIGGRGFGLLPERPRHRSKAAGAAFKAYWARRQPQLIGGGL